MAQTKYLDLKGLQHLIEKLVNREVQGKGLSTNDLTDELLAKLNSTATTEGLSQLTTKVDELNALIAADEKADGVINKFEEIVKFLEGIADTKTLQGLLGDIASQIAAKQSPQTTLAGYGITDAKIANGTITLGTQSITPIAAADLVAITIDEINTACGATA